MYFLLFFITFFVLTPTLASICIRYTVYGFLEQEINQTTGFIRNNSRAIYKTNTIGKASEYYLQASKTLENVNTPALLEKIYQELSFSFFGRQRKIEQWDSFCKILPNLLISFGLLGTFLGITLNLANISEVLNSYETDNLVNIDQLKSSLRSMVIAFVSSLTALLCSSILIIVNFSKNTSVLKKRLFSTIEDYLDNVYQSQIDGHTRLDKAVDRMAEKQDQFLTRFHEEVGQALTDRIEPIINKMAEENTKSSQNLNHLATEFMKSSGRFYDSSESLNIFANKIQNAIQHDNFITYATTLESSIRQFKNVSDSLESSKFPETLAKFTKLVIETQELCDEVKKLNRYSAGLLQSNQSKITAEIEFFEDISGQFSDMFNFLGKNQTAIQQSLSQLELGVINSLNQNSQTNLSAITEFNNKTNLVLISISEQIRTLKNSVDEAIAKQSNDVKSLADNALVKIHQYNQLIFDLLQEIQELQIKSNDHLNSTNNLGINMVEVLKLNNHNISFLIQQIQDNSNDLKILISEQFATNLNALSELLANILANNQEVKEKIAETYNQINSGNKHNARNVEFTIDKLDQIIKNISEIASLIEFQLPEHTDNSFIDRLRGT
ncbi:hypothetical protein [Synechocystis sp. CACIAM 05]|uniref:hypothetical protein n=1 Tax=Synechocystis sp. CACIAM 05 TaxID=1933929 RepID=UPI00138E7EA5|nr:hypothetical protein [Synechocystis sp. CACIAM 05]QHV01512.1 hypothetical protein BWK47_16160 [Synechocystis sp. CACIAM 05]